jgi:hypothetical protein
MKIIEAVIVRLSCHCALGDEVGRDDGSKGDSGTGMHKEKTVCTMYAVVVGEGRRGRSGSVARALLMAAEKSSVAGATLPQPFRKNATDITGSRVPRNGVDPDA